MSVEVMTSLDQFDLLASSWAELGPQQLGPMSSHDWFSCAARYYCTDATLHVIVVRRAGRLVAVAPLCRVRRRGIEWLEIIGDRALFEPMQLPAADEHALAALCAAIVTQGVPVFIERLQIRDRGIAMLEDAARRRGAFHVLPRAPTHHIPQGTSWADAHGTMTDYRRKRRKLEAQGAVTTSILAPAAGELAPALETVLQVESAGWKGRRGSSLLSNRPLRSFFADLCARLVARDALRICLLRCAEHTVAAQICAEQDGQFWVLKMGFDEQWARFSPGMLLTSDTIRYALGERQLGFEFLGVAESWQQQWRPWTRAQCAAIFYPARPAGIIALAMDRLADAARPLKNRGRGGERSDVV